VLNKNFINAERSARGDEVYTPFYAVLPIIKYLPKDKIIWLPFDEEWSAFYQLLKENGFQVVRSSLKEGRDFFVYKPKKFDIIVSNPPFSRKDDVLERMKSLGKPFMLLLPLASLQGKRRYECFKEGIQLLAFDSRVDYHTRQDFENYKPGNYYASVYFCKDILPRDIIIEKLEKYSRPLKIEMSQ